MIKLPLLLTLAFAAGGTFTGLDELPAAESSFAFRSLAAFDSLYTSEGRDNLDGASIGSLLLEMESGGWLIGSWLAASGEGDCEERTFFIERGFAWQGLEGYLGYKYLLFPRDANADDHEIGAGLSGPELPLGIVPEVNWTYAFEAEGSYLETGFTRGIALSDTLHIEPSLMIGRNDGFVSDGHHGFDYLRLALAAHLNLSERLLLCSHIGQSFALDADPDRFDGDVLLRDFLHGGIGLSWSF